MHKDNICHQQMCRLNLSIKPICLQRCTDGPEHVSQEWLSSCWHGVNACVPFTFSLISSRLALRLLHQVVVQAFESHGFHKLVLLSVWALRLNTQVSLSHAPLQAMTLGVGSLASRIWAARAALQLDKIQMRVREHTLQGRMQVLRNQLQPSGPSTRPELGWLPEASDPTFYRAEYLAFRKGNLQVGQSLNSP